MTQQFAFSLTKSKVLNPILFDKSGYLNPNLSHRDIYIAILKEKNINTEREHVIEHIKSCITGMMYVRDCFNKVEALRSTAFDSSNPEHEALLDELWKNFASVLPSEDSRDWSALGFQRRDEPRTDFRGMGILGLMNLVYISKVPAFRLLLKESHKLNYSFAITGINLTADLYKKLKTFDARYRFMDTSKDELTLFNEAFAAVFIQFHEYWRERKPDIMLFNEVKKDFWKYLEENNFWHVPQGM